eukprot:m.49843 g.49843  ORF g.49843 m.49843 type:complete len:65 (-) comp17957_c0_seq1:2084-2278(-)
MAVVVFSFKKKKSCSAQKPLFVLFDVCLTVFRHPRPITFHRPPLILSLGFATLSTILIKTPAKK